MAINIIDPNAPGQGHIDSYWAATAGPEIADAAPVAGDMEVDVAIVGGGYTGLSTALHLGRKFGLNLGEGYAIHGTNRPQLIGRSVSHGCVRLRNEDIERLYDMVETGTAVFIY